MHSTSRELSAVLRLVQVRCSPLPLLAAVILVLFARDSDTQAAKASDAPGGPALAGDLGQQDASGD
ncbi:MAG: hypothetical protein GEU97_17080 [Actinophytocola sp.]|nr:hypothetical protein [Actinophytocola sp.]